MRSTVNGQPRLSLWRHVREYAVPQSMIRSATARRAVGDWAGACAAARVDVDLDLRAVARSHGRELAARLRTDLRHLAPDLLRWHLPRVTPDGLVRPGLTLPLARYQRDGGGTVHLVARTPPGWADGGQRFSLALWDEAAPGNHAAAHPHRRPNPRFRLDLHRHLWDARRSAELRTRAGLDVPAGESTLDPELAGLRELGYAVDRWADEAALLLRAENRVDAGAVAVRLGGRRRLLLELTGGPDGVRLVSGPAARHTTGLPLLPDAATWVPPDVLLLREGLIGADRLHPLVAAALAPDHPTAGPVEAPTGPRLVECRGAQHRIGLVDGVLVPLDHDPAEIRREELLAALTGTPLACLRAIDEVHRQPEQLADIRARLDHGDTVGALTVVENLLGPEATLPDGVLRDELATAALRQVSYGLFRAGLADTTRSIHTRPAHRPRDHRGHPRNARHSVTRGPADPDQRPLRLHP
ncbi:hypothetical protein [Plantactinospora sp. B24E8]|uniref:hypothetical protein n=1 Tax=Plantactinospora sp. B24E8 TaxID=3153567 RepID=UPI00325C83B5